MNENINWLPKNKTAAICFSIDDIHPSKSTDFYECGGDLENGRLRFIKWLLDRHPKLKVTFFVTADWREISPIPTRKVLSKIPILRNRLYLAKRLRKGTMRLDRHPEFVEFLNEMERVEVALHGLHHCHPGFKIPVEFQFQTETEISKILDDMIDIFNNSNIDYISGFCPPGWEAPRNLLNQLVDHKIKFIASSRDIFTEISEEAKSNMSGIKGTSLIYPTIIHNNKIIHIPSNFNATSTKERAEAIIKCSGLLSIKGHIVKLKFGRMAYDGIDEIYMNYLDMLFEHIEKEYGDKIWWTSMGEISKYIYDNNPEIY